MVHVYLFVDHGVTLWCVFVGILYNVVLINTGIIFLKRVTIRIRNKLSLALVLFHSKRFIKNHLTFIVKLIFISIKMI